MKKYLFGVFAIALAIGFSSFTANHAKKTTKSLTSYTFGFFGNDAVLGQVSDKTKWTDISDQDPQCSDGGAEFACRITVSDLYTHPVGDYQVLNTSTDNPQSESILTIPEILTQSVSRYRVDESLASSFDAVDNADEE